MWIQRSNAKFVKSKFVQYINCLEALVGDCLVPLWFGEVCIEILFSNILRMKWGGGGLLKLYHLCAGATAQSSCLCANHVGYTGLGLKMKPLRKSLDAVCASNCLANFILFYSIP
jgi:hypothetical protein